MKQLVLHIGMPKTGTSTIQRFLGCNQALVQDGNYDYPLFEEYVGAYPVPRHISTGNGNPIVYGILNASGKLDCPPALSFDAVTGKIIAFVQSSPFEKVIISHEDLVSLSRPVLREFVTRLTAASITVKAILYFREQAAWLASDYQQHIKQLRADHDIGEHVRRRLRVCDYVGFSEKWQGIVEPDNLIVRLLSSKTVKHNLIYDFFWSLGTPIEALRSVNLPIANEGLDAVTLEILRLANKRKLPSEVVRVLYRTADRMPPENGRRKYELPPDLTRFVRAYYRDSNQKLAAFLNAEDAAELASVSVAETSSSWPQVPESVYATALEYALSAIATTREMDSTHVKPGE